MNPDGVPRLDRAALLNQCRGKFVDSAGNSVAALQTALLDSSEVDDLPLPDIAQRAEIAARWPEATAAFRSALSDFFDEQMRFAESSRLGKGYDFSASSLKLLDDAELEFAIELGDAGQRLREACEGELYKFDVRVAYLLDMPEIDEERHPLGVAAVIYALRLLVEHLRGPLALRLWLLRFVERKLKRDLPMLYADVNALLVRQGVLPRISPSFRRQDERAPGGGARPETSGAGGAQDALAQLRRAMSAPGGTELPMMPTMGRQSAAMGGGAISEAAIAALNATLQSLTRLQTQAVALGGENSKTLAGNEADLLSRIRSGDIASSALSGLDSSTVDLVAALFDGIFQDPDIPDSIKSLLGWLQIPLLKVALADPVLLSDSSNPVRRMLDVIGRISACLGRATGEDHAALHAIKKAISRIRDEFDRDLTLFEEVLKDLDPCGGGFHLPGYLPPQALADVVARYCRRVDSDAAVAGVIEPALRRNIPAVIAAFLDEQWRAVLGHVHATAGERHEDWIAYTSLVDDLLWSVGPREAADSRKRLVALLPGMLQRLNNGLALIATPQPERDRFLDALFALHSRAMKAAAHVPVAAHDVDADRAAEAIDFHTGGTWAHVHSPPDDDFVVTTQTMGKVEVVSLFRKRATGSHGRIEAVAGDCVEFRLPDHEAQRACLCRDQTEDGDVRVLVFFAANTARAFVVSAVLLASLLRGHYAQWVARDSLVQRAVSRKLESLRAAAH